MKKAKKKNLQIVISIYISILIIMYIRKSNKNFIII